MIEKRGPRPEPWKKIPRYQLVFEEEEPAKETGKEQREIGSRKPGDLVSSEREKLAEWQRAGAQEVED